MTTLFQWFSVFVILLVSLAGGYAPLFRGGDVEGDGEFPLGEAFATGVFLALSLTIMLPAGFSLFQASFPRVHYPVASVIAITTFLILLSIEHYLEHLRRREETRHADSPVFPIIMTIMIAIPSFFLGVALGVSALPSAAFVLVAILAHKGSAGFALALKLSRSSMSKAKSIGFYCLFACSTPTGIIFGEDLHDFLSGREIIAVKAVVLSLAAGVFLYMSTLHELRNSPLIERCCTKRGFLVLIVGFVLTALVRMLLT